MLHSVHSSQSNESKILLALVAFLSVRVMALLIQVVFS